MDDTARLFADARPELVFHLAAEVGGIGANRANPGRYWYANLSWARTCSSRAACTRSASSSSPAPSAPTRSTRPSRSARTRSGTAIPEETNAPYGVAKKAVLVGAQAYREQYGLNAIYLLPANLYGPRDNFDLESSHVIPALIRKMLDVERTRSCSGATARRRREFLYVDDCVEGLVLAAERYDGAEPVNLGTGVETSIRELAETIADVTGFEGEIVWDTSMPNGQPRRSLDASRAEELVRLPRRDAAARRARAHGRLVPLARAGACGWLSGSSGSSQRPSLSSQARS